MNCLGECEFNVNVNILIHDYLSGSRAPLIKLKMTEGTGESVATQSKKRRIDNSDENDVCIICFQSNPTAALSCCDAKTHISCMAQWQQTGGQQGSNSCPQCRKNFHENPIPTSTSENEEDDSYGPILFRRETSMTWQLLVLISAIKGDRVTGLDDDVYFGNVAKKSLATLNCMSAGDDEDALAMMAMPEIGLLELLINVVCEDPDVARSIGLKILFNLSRTENNYDAMLADDGLGLVTILVHVFCDDDTLDNKVCALDTLTNLACTDDEDALKHMACPDYNLIPTLIVSLCTESRRYFIRDALRIFRNLSVCDEIGIHMCDTRTLLSCVMDIIAKEPDHQDDAFGILRNLAAPASNAVKLIAPELGLLELLVRTVQTTDGTAALEALGTLRNISCGTYDSMLAVRDPSLGLLEWSMAVIRERRDEIRTEALRLLTNFACGQHDFSKNHSAEKDMSGCDVEGEEYVYGAVEVEEEGGDGEGEKEVEDEANEKKGKQRGIYEQPGLGGEGKATHPHTNNSISSRSSPGAEACQSQIEGPSMASFPGLLELLADLVKTDEGEARVQVLCALQNLTGVESNAKAVASPALGLLTHLTTLLSSEDPKTCEEAVGVLWNVAETSSPEMAQEMIRSGSHTALVDLITRCCDEKNTTLLGDCLNMLMGLSRHAIVGTFGQVKMYYS